MMEIIRLRDEVKTNYHIRDTPTRLSFTCKHCNNYFHDFNGDTRLQIKVINEQLLKHLHHHCKQYKAMVIKEFLEKK